MKSVETQILEWLQSNSGVHHGGDIQRLLFKTRNGGNSTGDTIKRRLNDLVEEGKAFVTYNEKHEAMFSANPAELPKKYTYQEIEKDGQRIMTKVLVSTHS